MASKRGARVRSAPQPRARRARTAASSKRRLRPLRLIGRWGLAALIFPSVAWGALLFWGQRAPSQAASAGEHHELVLLEGGTYAAGQALAMRGWIASPWLFQAYALLVEPWQRPTPGRHWISAERSPSAWLRLLSRGRGRPARRVLLPEGENLFEVAARLARAGICSEAAFVEVALGAAPPATSAEGYLYPATYEFWENTPPERVAGRLRAEAERRFELLFKEQQVAAAAVQRQLGLTRRELVVLASMVEEEAHRPDEMGRIARVFLNRLSDPEFRPRRMLQSDPTAGYGCRLKPELSSCAAFNGRITPQLLRDALNPYNTYRHPGLPPGPITSPSVRALRAVVLAPEDSALFFVANGQGGHHFSRTLSEHRLATRRAKASESAGATGASVTPSAGTE